MPAGLFTTRQSSSSKRISSGTDSGTNAVSRGGSNRISTASLDFRRALALVFLPLRVICPSAITLWIPERLKPALSKGPGK
jgi:hypothetical protein